MLARLSALLARAGVPPDVTALLAPRVLTPDPGSIDVTALRGASETQLALLSALVAAAHFQDCGTALTALLALVRRTQSVLSDYDNGRFWHLKGFAAMYLDHDLASAACALHRSLACLQSNASPQMRAYQAQVYETLGQLFQRQGRLREARAAVEQALHHREVTDAEGTVCSLEQLGRLCMDLGDFASAAEYLARTLNIVTQRTPRHTKWRAQLLAQLGTCALGRGGLTAARNYFQQSKRLAQADGDVYGLAVAALGLGQRAVRCGKMATTLRQVQAVERLLDDPTFPAAAVPGVRSALSQLVAARHLAQQRPAAALAAYREARCARTTDVSPLESAQLLYGLAQAALQHGDRAQAALALRDAIQALAPTTAERLRQEIATLYDRLGARED